MNPSDSIYGTPVENDESLYGPTNPALGTVGVTSVTAPVAAAPTRPFGDLSFNKIIQGISNSFVGLVQDLFSTRVSTETLTRALAKEQRYLYLALLVIIFIIIGDVMNALHL